MKKDLIFTGAGTALVTPFTSAGEIAWEELDRLVEFQLENNIDAIIACGTTGEAATMTGEEHLEVIDFISSICDQILEVNRHVFEDDSIAVPRSFHALSATKGS